MSVTVVWFRQDLRLGDHEPLRRAAERGGVVPAFVWSPEEDGAWPPGAASRWWLHRSLMALDAALGDLGSRLVIRRGPTTEALRAIARESGATHAAWHRRYEPHAEALEARVATALREDGIDAAASPGTLLVEPADILGASGAPRRIFTPFWRALRSGPAPPLPFAPPRGLVAPGRWPRSAPVASLGLTGADAHGLETTWTPGEAGARARLRGFRRVALASYAAERDVPRSDATSRLSPHLRWGELSMRQAWAAGSGTGGEAWLRQLAWREFSQHALANFPTLPERPLRAPFERMPWARGSRALRAWQRGETGYPLVDAGMRELATTGFMHGRVRMIAGSFLVKHLMVRWQEGERWFWDRLVDADLGNNAVSWQWVAGCGFDSSPWFRIFNPVAKSKRFDPRGDYVKRWVPELSALAGCHVHAPWDAPPRALAAAGVTLGRTYPRPIVDHATARARALAAFAAIRRAE